LSGQNIVSSATKLDEIYSISKSVSTNGYISIFGNAGAVSCAVIAPERLDVECMKIGLYPIPSSTAHSFRYLEKVETLVQDNDIPKIPDQFHELLILGGMIRGLRWMEDDNRLPLLQGEYQKGINELVEASQSGVQQEIPCDEETQNLNYPITKNNY
jgi:hypothetical protein